MTLYDGLQCLVTAIVSGILLFVFVGRTVGVDGESMLPTLRHQDRLIVSRLCFKPEYGDIVILKAPALGDALIVKRVIATEGQEVDIDFIIGTVTVDGNALIESYIADLTRTQWDFQGPLTVPEGCVFVMGDNRNDSLDSRSDRVGLVDVRSIIGKAYWLCLPGRNENGTRSWNRLGSVYKNM